MACWTFLIWEYTHNQIIKIRVKLNKENEILEKNIVDLKDYIKFSKNNNNTLGEEIASIRSETLRSNKCESYKSLKMK